jgi:hypothetical protein
MNSPYSTVYFNTTPKSRKADHAHPKRSANRERAQRVTVHGRNRERAQRVTYTRVTRERAQRVTVRARNPRTRAACNRARA